MTSDRSFFLAGRDLADEPLHYRACGLDDVFLLNGFTRESTDYGDAVAVEAIGELHRAIAERLVSHRKRLSPREFRFLRKQMDFTQQELAASFGIDAQTVARYEKGETAISGPADRLVRFVYVFSRLPREAQLAALDEVNRLAELDEPPHAEPLRFRATEHGWADAA